MNVRRTIVEWVNHGVEFVSARELAQRYGLTIESHSPGRGRQSQINVKQGKWVVASYWTTTQILLIGGRKIDGGAETLVEAVRKVVLYVCGAQT